MRQAVKGFLAVISLFCIVSFAAFAQTADSSFDVKKFGELATRAENVVSSEQASTEALEILRSDLVNYRKQALSAQNSVAQRVETVQKQINVLGPAPEGDLTESEEIAARRMALSEQLAKASAPMIVAQEANKRASGLIGEIDKIVRARQRDMLFQVDNSPLNPTNWPVAITALTKHINVITAEVRTQWSSEIATKVRKQNGPIILVLMAIGFVLMLPVTRWAARSLNSAKDRKLRKFGDVSHLVKSIAVFIVPMLGLFCITIGLYLTEFFSVHGDFLFDTIPQMGVAILGANWLARNLPQGQFFNGKKRGLVLGGQRTIWAMGVVIATGYLLDAFATAADWPSGIKSVLFFPLIVLLGYCLFRGGQKIRIYRGFLQEDEEATNIQERIATIFMWACYISGVFGPLLATFGYSNAGETLVFSMTMTLALSAAVFFVYVLLVRFISHPPNSTAVAISDERPSDGLYKVALGFALICASVPVYALIWGARVSDITNLWFTLNEGVSLGDTKVSISDFLVFILIFFIGYTITRLLQSTLRTTVLPNTRIEEGAQNALATGFGYIGIFLAALVAIMTTGLDLSNLAIVAGALSVGIGFGLQAIVSNFVSGIILLVERPVKIGDWVEVGAYSGNISKISVRSTSIDTFDGATVILPNADLVAGTVTNWTHGNVRGRVKVPIGVAYGTDPELVKEVLLSIGEDHPITLKRPEPWVVFMGFGADSMNFELRAIIRDINYVLSTSSDMNYEIVKRFAEKGIEIPFAQRVVTIKNPEAMMPKPARKSRAKPKA
jgi:small-conductance mechanosensitive channel